MDDLVIRLGVIQLGLQEQSLGVEFLGSSHIGLGAESLSPHQLLMQNSTGFGAQGHQFLGYLPHLVGPLQLVICRLHCQFDLIA